MNSSLHMNFVFCVFCLRALFTSVCARACREALKTKVRVSVINNQELVRGGGRDEKAKNQLDELRAWKGGGADE